MKLHDVYKGAIQILYHTIMGRGFGVACKFPKMACLKTGENGGKGSGGALKLCINIPEKTQISFIQ